MKYVFVLFVLISATILGCEQSPVQQESDQPETEKIIQTTAKKIVVEPLPVVDAAKKSGQSSEVKSFQPFYVFSTKGSRDNHYIPSGFMPDGKCITFSDVWQKDCQHGQTCIKIEYDVECSRKGRKWAGVYWLNPANNWGSRKGGYNLTGAQRLTFWARGERGGEQIQEFTMGGITGDYPDTDTSVIGPVILGAQWRQYVIDLRGKDLSYISGGFAWTTSEDVNPEGCTFYLDNIKFE